MSSLYLKPEGQINSVVVKSPLLLLFYSVIFPIMLVGRVICGPTLDLHLPVRPTSHW
jgi:hypothetical protein